MATAVEPHNIFPASNMLDGTATEYACTNIAADVNPDYFQIKHNTSFPFGDALVHLTSIDLEDFGIEFFLPALVFVGPADTGGFEVECGRLPGHEPSNNVLATNGETFVVRCPLSDENNAVKITRDLSRMPDYNANTRSTSICIGNVHICQDVFLPSPPPVSPLPPTLPLAIPSPPPVPFPPFGDWQSTCIDPSDLVATAVEPNDIFPASNILDGTATGYACTNIAADVNPDYFQIEHNTSFPFGDALVHLTSATPAADAVKIEYFLPALVYVGPADTSEFAVECGRLPGHEPINGAAVNGQTFVVRCPLSDENNAVKITRDLSRMPDYNANTRSTSICIGNVHICQDVFLPSPPP